MKARQELLIRCVELLADNGTAFADAFYSELFRRCPEVPALFVDSDMANQGLMLVSLLSFVLESLDNPATLQRRLRHLGHMHARAGVREEHFTAFLACLRDTAQAFAGQAWTPEMAALWDEALGVIRTQMLIGLGEATA